MAVFHRDRVTMMGTCLAELFAAGVLDRAGRLVGPGTDPRPGSIRLSPAAVALRDHPASGAPAAPTGPGGGWSACVSRVPRRPPAPGTPAAIASASCTASVGAAGRPATWVSTMIRPTAVIARWVTQPLPPSSNRLIASMSPVLTSGP